MMKNIDEINLLEELIESDESALLSEPVRIRGRKPLLLVGRIRRILARILFIVYIVGILAFGYWYYSRPVRPDQFRNAHRVWYSLLDEFGVPVPKDERWGG
ncbi:MAG TPA: hypothetical protein ENN67_07525 [Firmicutes bacterium]|nr:hypothetical protein [Bacillota bacterium]